MTKGGDWEGISNKRLVPELRFSEFRERFDWNEDKFCDLFQILSNNTLSRSELSNGKGDVYNIHYGDVLIKFNEYLDVKKEKLPYIKDETKAERYKIAYLKDGDVVMADTAEDETAGKCTEAINVGDAIVVAGLHTIPCRPRKMFARAYLGYYMNSKVFHDRLLPIMQGAKVTSIPKSSLQNISLVYPQDLEEQQKISECLSSIDEEISAIKEKIDQLKEHKKGLMQKLFPIEGMFLPKVRFPEFINNKEWEEKKLGDLCEIGNGKDYKHLNKGCIPVYGSGGYMTSVDNFLYDGDSACIGRKGTIDKPIFLTGKFWTVDTLFYTHSFCYCIPKFLYCLFQQIDWYKYNEAGGVPSLSKKTIENIKLPFPSPAEQQKIAECLSSIDELISLYENKVTLLEQHKKGLMQRLFPKL